MPKKEDTPLQSLQKETDALQKNVNAFDKEVNAFLKKKTEDREKSRLFYTSSQEHMCTVEELLRKLENLNPEDESMKLSKFESKKKDETKKINNTKEKLSKISTRFEPDEVEEGKVQEEGIEAEDSEEDDEDEEDEEDEDDEDEDDEEEEEDSTVMDTMEIEKERAAATKKGKDAGVKSKKADVKTEPKREVVDMPKAGSSKQSAANIEEESEEEDDEEDEEEDEDDEDEESEGDVSGEDDDEDEEEEDDDEEESDDEEDEDEEEVATGTGMFITLEDFEAEQKDDLAFKQGEVLTVISSRPDGWCEARNAQGHQGMVPCTYLQVYKDEEQDDDDENEDEEDEDSEVQSPTTPRSGRNLWKNIKSAVRETSATDVLHALGAMPSGFRDSSLAKMKKQDQYSMKNILAPKLSPSCVSYRDVFQSEDTDLIRPRTVKIQRIITLVQARQIPLPGTGVEVKSRHVRVCLFDGQNIVSNIHTIGISGLDKDQRTWNFNNKMEVKKSFNFGEIFIRSNSNDSDIGILFELCVSFLRTSTGQEGELSCGWTHLKLFDAEGKPIQNKTFDEPVQGGTIYDRGVELDPSVGKKASQIQNLGTTTNMFRSLVASNKQPRLVIRIVDPTKDQKTYLDTLPDVVLSSTTYISYLSFYRQVLCDVLLRDRIDPQSTELVHSPLLTTFPEVIEQPDLMDVLRTVWADKMKVTKRAEKKDLVTLKDRFRQVYLENIYPLFGCASLPPYKVGNPQIEEERFTEITRQVNMNKIGLVKSLLSADVKHRPFDISELAFDVMGPYCMTKAHGV